MSNKSVIKLFSSVDGRLISKDSFSKTLFESSLKPVRDLDSQVRETGYMLDKNTIVELELIAEVSDSVYLVNSASSGLGLIPKSSGLVFFNKEEVLQFKHDYAKDNIAKLEEYLATPHTTVEFEK